MSFAALLLLPLAPLAAARAHGEWADPEYFSPGAVAGIVIGAIAALCLVLAFIFFIVWLRKREPFWRRRHRESLMAEAARPAGVPVAGAASRPTAAAASVETNVFEGYSEPYVHPNDPYSGHGIPTIITPREAAGTGGRGRGRHGQALRPPASIKSTNSADEDRMLYN